MFLKYRPWEALGEDVGRLISGVLAKSDKK
jgi:hypothetical protein